MNLPHELDGICDTLPHRLVFATVSGAHLYGFPSPDSDYDLRGCHVLPVTAMIGLDEPEETEERLGLESGLDLDLVSHDLRKFSKLLLKRNGYVLEQLLSPLIVRTSSEHEELKRLVPKLLTRHHAHHYLGFANNQWRLFEKSPRVKTLLYVYRVLLTGIHLMKTAEVEPNLPTLLEHLPQDGVQELIQAKIEGAEKQALPESEVERHRAHFESLMSSLVRARDETALPETPSAYSELNDLVVRTRLA